MTGKMETPFYHDDSVPSFGQIPEYERYQGQKLLKKSGVCAQVFPGAAGLKLAPGGGAGPSMMPAGELSLLKLGPAELEHLVLPSGPSAAAAFPYRGQATHEQEGFADGFVKALADLHKQNQLVGAPMSPSSSAQGPYQRGLMPDAPVYTNLSSYGPAPVPSAYPAGPMAYAPAQGLQTRPDAPQTVPEVPPSPASPALSPIDLETQERIKAERKKLRNRIAASKCRKRKLERISRLEEKVKVLKTQNSDLASTAGILRQQVAQLKQKVMNHVTNGCQITVGSGASKSAETSC